MRKMLIYAGILALSCFIACKTNNEQSVLPLDSGWKFNTGDDQAWATAAYNDGSWKTIDPKKNWEDQGYKGYDGFAWYRMHIMIPSSLKANAFIKDSLQIQLGRIDD